jgi:hypothetical protein
VIRALERLGVRYYVCGSLASSVHGDPRSTNDADIVADLRPAHAAPLVAELAGNYVIDEETVLEAIARGRSFNLIDVHELCKIDVFCATGQPHEEASFVRKSHSELQPGDPFSGVDFASAEDTVAYKLHWFRKGGEVSSQQWRDVIGVLRAKAGMLDMPYLRHWSQQLGVEDLLDRALKDAGD